MIYVSQSIMLYTLNIHSAACPYISIKLGEKKEFWQRIETIFFQNGNSKTDTKNSKDRFNSRLDTADKELVTQKLDEKKNISNEAWEGKRIEIQTTVYQTRRNSEKAQETGIEARYEGIMAESFQKPIKDTNPFIQYTLRA